MMPRIKVLHILEATLGGTRKHVFDLLNHMDLEEFEIVFCYSTLRADINFFSDIDIIKNRGIRLIEIPMNREIAILKDTKSFIALYKLIKKEYFNIVHVHSSKAGFLGRIAAKCVSRRIKTIYTPNSLPVNINKLYKYFEKIVIPFTDIIIAVSESEKKEIIKNKLTTKIRKINSGVKVLLSKDKNGILHKEFNISENILIVISIGRLTKQKDPLTFFKAAKDFITTVGKNSVLFLWIGDGELRSVIEDYIGNNKIFECCKILGWRTNIEELLWDADVFVLTSIYESFGYVTCEAMAHFLPVIATNVVGTSDIVNDECGFLVEKEDFISISQHINVLIKDSELRRLMGQKGSLRVKEYFNLYEMVNNTEKLYKEYFRTNE